MKRPAPPIPAEPDEAQSACVLLDAGCWLAVGDARFDGRAALFLDRDGVLVEEVNYLGRPADVALIPGAAEVVGAFNRAGVPVVLVTNQSGVARGYFGWSDFEAVQAEIDRRLAGRDAHLDAVFACGYHEDGRGALAVAGHPWRKPHPGMLLAAAERLGIDLARSAIVGDRAQDLAAGRAAGLGSGIQVASGHGGSQAEQAAALALDRPGFQVTLAADLTAAHGLLPRLAGARPPC